MRRELSYLQPYDAGVFPEELSRRLGIPLDRIANLKSNENPYQPPERVLKTIAEEATRVSRYPDPGYPELKEALSTYLDVPVESISVGRGASEVISNLCAIFLEPLDKAVIPVPTYMMYAFHSMLRDARLELIESDQEDFALATEEVAAASRDASMVFICSPNNPTGAVVEESEIMRIAEATKAVVVVDEAYAEFHGRSMVSRALELENLVVLRSFSKFFALAGLRVGYAVSSPTIAQVLEKVRPPFTLSNVAAKAAVSALEEKRHYMRLGSRIVRERERLLRELKSLEPLQVFPSKANFILVRLKKGKASHLFEELCREGILVRDVTGLPGLKGECLRITVGRRSENRRLVSALRRILGGG